MTILSRNLTKSIAVLMGILMSVTALFGQTPAPPRNRVEKNRMGWEKFVPNFIGSQFRKFRLDFHKKSFNHRCNRHRRFNNKRRNCYGSRGGQHRSYERQNRGYGRW